MTGSPPYEQDEESQPYVDNAPNPWSIVHEYSKTVVTLSSALLAITVTFSEKILSPTTRFEQRALLIAIWGSLLLAIIASLLSSAKLSNFLRYGHHANRCIRFSNIAFFFLTAAAVGFAALGSLQVLGQPTNDTSKTVQQAATALQRSEGGEGWNPIAWIRQSDHITVTLVRGVDTAQIRVDNNDGDITEYTRIR
jgi:hypothetical protein